MKLRFPLVPSLIALVIAAMLLAFLTLPIGTVVLSAFGTSGKFTLQHFVNSFGQSPSVLVFLLSVVFASLIAIPLAYFTVYFEFRGAVLIQTLGVLPFVIPPFVGAVAPTDG